MANKTQTIRIESILGGHAPMSHFAAPDQFKTSLGIDPSLPTDDDLNGINGSLPSGLLRPMSAYNATGTITSAPMWIDGNPKEEGTIYVYDAAGSVHTVNDSVTTLTGLGDLNDGGSANGNGMAYYDNYMYFARSTTIARYGPLNGAPSFTDDYWVGTLGKTALSNTTYPVDFDYTVSYPNHVLHRHSDGKLYVADVVDNQGTLHYIKTAKTTVEGDTDNGSTYDALNVGYGLWPVAMESLGSVLVISFIELAKASSSRTLKTKRAKIAFWDTTSQDVNQITWEEYPDQMATALKNVNGVLHIAGGNQYTQGFRVTKYIGGSTFEDEAFIETGQPPFPGAIDGSGQRLVFGSWTQTPESAGCVYSIGLQKGISTGLFNIISVWGQNRDGNYTTSPIVTALKLIDSSFGTLLQNFPVVGHYTNISDGGAVSGVGAYNAPSVWISQTFRIGQNFKITKLSIPLVAPNNFNMAAASLDITPTITVDGGQTEVAFPVINTTNYLATTKRVVIQPTGLTGQYEFSLKLRWYGGTVVLSVGLPITIEYELIDD